MASGLIIDVFLLLVFFVCVFSAARRGFVRTVLGIASYIVSGLLAGFLSRAFAPKIYGVFFSNNIINTLTDKMDSIVKTSDPAARLDAVYNVFPFLVRGASSEFAGPKGDLAAQINGMITNSAQVSAEKIEHEVIAPIVTGIISIVLFILLFIVLLVVCRILVRIIDKAFKLPVISQLNKTLGALLGIVEGLFFVALISVFLNALWGPGASASWFAGGVQSSYIIGAVRQLGFSAVGILV